MRLALVDTLPPGVHVLARPVYGDRGELLLARGELLSERRLTQLRARGVRGVWVRTWADDVAGVDPDDVLREQTRINATSAVARLADAVLGRSRARDEVEAVRLAAEAVLDDVLAAEAVLDGLVAVKSHDAYTYVHSCEVAAAAVAVGWALHMDRASLRELALGGLLHDIGKTRLPREVLHAPRPLTAGEWALMRLHPVWGYEILTELELPEVLVRYAALQHHERQDGKGYPHGLRGLNRIGRSQAEMLTGGYIVLAAEITAAADTYCAASSDRAYSPGLPPDRALDLLRSVAGTQLNAEVVEALCCLLPRFPTGVEVVVVSGPWAGWRGVVARVRPGAPDRPVVRLVLDPALRPAVGHEVDFAREEGELRCELMPAPVGVF